MLRYYRGKAACVSVVAEDGRRVRFPAENLRPFVTREGIHGRFALRFDEHNRLQGMDRIG